MDLNVKKKYLIFNLINATTKDNRPYLKMVFTDSDGSAINAIMFDSNKLKFAPEKGDVVEVAGCLQHYNGMAQLKVSDMEKAADGDPNEFLPKSARDSVQMAEELKRVLDKNLKSPYFRKLAGLFINDEEAYGAFLKKPAAKSVHHAYVHGLLEHTLSIIKLCVIVADYYGGDVNKELLVIGALFHDSGKILEIDSDSAFEYTDEGKLLGHLVLGMELASGYMSRIENFPKKARDLVIHMIASHHGYLEFGSPKRPKTKEALILHFVDNLDAKLATLDSIFDKEDVPRGGWSSYDRLLERQLYRHDLASE